jgi:hypothetical protein
MPPAAPGGRSLVEQVHHQAPHTELAGLAFQFQVHIHQEANQFLARIDGTGLHLRVKAGLRNRIRIAGDVIALVVQQPQVGDVVEVLPSDGSQLDLHDSFPPCAGTKKQKPRQVSLPGFSSWDVRLGGGDLPEAPSARASGLSGVLNAVDSEIAHDCPFLIWVIQNLRALILRSTRMQCQEKICINIHSAFLYRTSMRLMIFSLSLAALA